MHALWPTERLRQDLPGERPSPFPAARGVDPPHTWSGAPRAPQAGLGRRGSPRSGRGTPASRPLGSRPGDARGPPCRVWVGGSPGRPAAGRPGSTGSCARRRSRPGALAPLLAPRSALTTGVCRPDSPAPRRGSQCNWGTLKPRRLRGLRRKPLQPPSQGGELRPNPSSRAFHLQRRPGARAGAGAVCRLPGPSGSRCRPRPVRWTRGAETPASPSPGRGQAPPRALRRPRGVGGDAGLQVSGSTSGCFEPGAELPFSLERVGGRGGAASGRGAYGPGGGGQRAGSLLSGSRPPGRSSRQAGSRSLHRLSARKPLKVLLQACKAEHGSKVPV